MICQSKIVLNEKKIKNDTPGPGSYLAFSEFGVWVPKSMSRSIKANRRIKENPLCVPSLQPNPI